MVPVAGVDAGISPVLGSTLKVAAPNPGAIIVKLPLYYNGSAPLTVTMSSTDKLCAPSVLIVI